MKKSKKYQHIFSYETKTKIAWGYRYKFYDDLHQRQEVSKRGFSSEKEAYKALLDTQVKIANSGLREIQSEKLTVGQWLDIWYESYKDGWEVTTRVNRRNFIKQHGKRLLGNIKLQQLDTLAYQRLFIQPLLKDFKPSTVGFFHTLMKISMNAAVNAGKISKNPITNITLPSQEKRHNVLTSKELDSFLRVAKGEENNTTYTLLSILAYSGMRVGEALGLQLKDINFKTNTLSVNHTRDGSGLRTPKTKNSYRKIKIDSIVMDHLKKYVDWLSLLKQQFGFILEEESLVFCSYQTGSPVAPSSVHYMVKRVCKKAGLESKISPHGLRHTHATLLLQSGAPIISVAKRLGNTPNMIMNIYGHVLDEMEDQLVEDFSLLVGAANAKTGEDFGEHS